MPWLAVSVMSESCAGGRPARTEPPSGIGVPFVDGVMSTAACPRSDTDPSVATDWSVMRSRTLLLTSNVMSTCSPPSSMPRTVPTSTPATRTGDPGVRPGTAAKRVFNV